MKNKKQHTTSKQENACGIIKKIKQIGKTLVEVEFVKDEQLLSESDEFL